MTRDRTERRARLATSTVISVGLTFLLATSACSDDEGSATPSTTVTAGDDFAARFSSACLDVDRQIEGLPEPVGLRSLGDIARQAATITDDGVERLRSIKAPPDVAGGVADLIDGLAAQSEIFTRLADSAGAGDRAVVDQISTEGEVARRGLATQADALGLDCGLEGEVGGSGPGDLPDIGDATMSPEDAASPTAIPEFGEDPALDALARDCSGGDPQACDLLSLSGAPSSGYEEYGATCGGRNDSLAANVDTFCVDLYPEAVAPGVDTDEE